MTSYDTDSAASLNATRHTLIRQLTDHPDDVGATVELQAVNAASNRLRTVDTVTPDALRRGGLSNLDRARLWLHRGNRRGA